MEINVRCIRAGKTISNFHCRLAAKNNIEVAHEKEYFKFLLMRTVFNEMHYFQGLPLSGPQNISAALDIDPWLKFKNKQACKKKPNKQTNLCINCGS